MSGFITLDNFAKAWDNSSVEVVKMPTVRALRERRGWSQAELARRARIGAPDLSRIERGLLWPYPKQARRLARALGVTEADLGVESVTAPQAGRA